MHQLHGTLMMREMCDPSAALPDIVEQFIQPHKREMALIVGGLQPGLGRDEVERCVFSIVGQVFFYRQMFPALRVMIGITEPTRPWLRAVAEQLDPLRLLEEIRAVQQHLAALAAGQPSHLAPRHPGPLDGFLKGLATAWQQGEVNAGSVRTYCRRALRIWSR